MMASKTMKRSAAVAPLLLISAVGCGSDTGATTQGTGGTTASVSSTSASSTSTSGTSTSGTGGGTTSSSSGTGGGHAKSLADIQHIVVIVLENWSFDSLYGEFAGAEGLSSAAAKIP